MTRGRMFLISIMVLGLSLISIVVFAQGYDLGQRVVIYPWEGEVTVSTDDTVFLAGRWSTCTRGLAKAWTKTSFINYTVDGEPLFASQKEAQQYWGQPVPDDNPWQENCVNKSAARWTVYWEYELSKLETGSHPISFEMGTDHPFHDGFDFDQDGKPDLQVWRYEFDLIINVIEGGAISGAVYEESGGPLEGLDVVACLYDNFELCRWDTTDVDGNYMIYPVPEDEYRVHIFQQEEWVEEFYDNTPMWDFAIPVPVLAHRETPNINFSLERGGAISGMVEEELGGSLEGIDVVACWFDHNDFCWGAMTDETGNYRIFSVPSGIYRVFVYQQGFWMEEFYFETQQWDEATRVRVKAGDETSPVNFTLTLGGSISGIVEDELGQPVASVWVDACEYDEMEEPYCMGGETNENGEYTIEGLPKGDYIVSIWNQGWVSQFYDVDPSDGEPDRVSVSPGLDTAGIDFSVVKAGSISGSVMTEYDDPVENLRVDACEYDVWEDPYCEGGETNEDGEYTIIGLPEGDYIVSIWNQGWVSQFYDVDPSDGEPDRVSVSPGLDTGGINFTVVKAGSISGSVMTEFDDPVENLRVDACEYDVWEDPYCEGAETNEDGEYTILGLPEGDYIVSIWNQGWVNQFYDVNPSDGEPDRVSVSPGLDTGGINFTVVKAGSISGSVMTEFDDPVENLWVDACEYDEMEEPYCMSAETNEDGEYTILGLPEGDYIVSIWNQGWVSQFYDVAPSDGEPDRVSVSPGLDTGGIDFTVVEAGSISGSVMTEFDDPVENLWVDACEYYVWEDPYCESDETNENGEYTIEGLPEGDYIVSIWNQGWVSQFYDVEIPYGEPDRVAAVAGQNHGGVDFTLVQAGIISGMVYESDGVTQIPNIGVDIVEGGYGVCTDETGFYSIASLPFGTYDIVAGRDFCGEGGFAESIAEDITVSSDTPYVEGLNFNLTRAGTISGRVFESNGITPIPNIGVDVVEGGHGACTDESGYYMIGSLPFGTYDIVAGRDFCGEGGFADAVVEDVTVTVDAPDVEELNFNLLQAASVSGRVVDTLGHEIVGILVEVNYYDTYEWAGGASTDSDGNYFVSGLAPGDYRICIWNPSWIFQCYSMALPGDETNVTLESGEHRGDIDFILTPAGTISGRVFESDGVTSIPNIGVDVVVGGHGTCTDENGYYMIGPVPFGTYDIVAGRDFCGEGGFVEAMVEDITISAEAPDVGELNFNLIQGGSISGTITDQEGNPVVGIGIGACQFYVVEEPACYGAETNSLGEYTMYGLIPDHYLVFVSGQEGWVDERFFENTDTPVLVKAGQDSSGINFTLEPTP